MTATLRSIKKANVVEKLVSLYCDLVGHEGYGDLRLEVRILKRGQKEVIVHCGKQYRFVIDQTEEIECVKDVLRDLG